MPPQSTPSILESCRSSPNLASLMIFASRNGAVHAAICRDGQINSCEEALCGLLLEAQDDTLANFHQAQLGVRWQCFGQPSAIDTVMNRPACPGTDPYWHSAIVRHRWGASLSPECHETRSALPNTTCSDREYVWGIGSSISVKVRSSARGCAMLRSRRPRRLLPTRWRASVRTWCVSST